MRLAFLFLLIAAGLTVACFIRNEIAVFDGLSLLALLAVLASVGFAAHAAAVAADAADRADAQSRR